jgi:hypothetical protein
MHADKYSIMHGLVQKEQARRIWWTLYIFDEEISLRGGKPASILEGHLSNPPPPPSEQVGPFAVIFVPVIMTMLIEFQRSSIQV